MDSRDQLGTHVVGDSPPGEPTGVPVDLGRRVRVAVVSQRQVGGVPDVALVRRRGGEVPLEQVGSFCPIGSGIVVRTVPFST